MTSQAVAILRVGLVTAVGLSAPASCAAFRAKVTNPSQTRVTDSYGDWIKAQKVPQLVAVGRARLAELARMAIEECLAGIVGHDWEQVPMLLCVAERERPGRVEGLDDRLIADVQRLLGIRAAPTSTTIAEGRIGICVALKHARELIRSGVCRQVLVVASDSLLQPDSLEAYEADGRLLTPRNSNGFVPGEAAGALLVGTVSGGGGLRCCGIGLGREPAHLHSGEPLRADGLTAAIKAALSDAGLEMHDIGYRLADLSGEHYYFKEASIGLSRTLRQRKREFDIWHPAECFGETGAAAGVGMFAIVDAAARIGYAPGLFSLVHFANDDGARAAAVLHCAGAA